MNQPIDTFHELLVQGGDFAVCKEQVLRFFARTLLLRYDRIEIVEEKSLPATAPAFRARVEAGLAANRRELSRLLAELQASGVTTLAELELLPTGYQSKLVHLIAHLLDGFIGIDSRFYNLASDSHGLTPEDWEKIAAAPGHYWLLHLEASSLDLAEASLIHR